MRGAPTLPWSPWGIPRQDEFVTYLQLRGGIRFRGGHAVR